MIEGRSNRLLVIDDEDEIRWLLGERLRGLGYTVEEATTGGEAMERIGERPELDLVLLDYRLPDVSGMQVLERIKATSPETPVIMMTGYSSVETAVEAMRFGAYDYATKPLDLEAIVPLVAKALTDSEPQRELRSVRSGAAGVASLVGESTGLRAVRDLISRVAESPVLTVLVTGESGTGKDLAARTLHHVSPRARAPFINITCSALPEHLLESELFGHEAGAFAGADRLKKGLLELADAGTVFFDEIAELSPPLQAKLLRFIEERAFRRVGGARDIQVDVRVVAATNRDLTEAVEEGSFRRDLFYRLQVVPVHMPALREHKDDVAPLARHFIGHFRNVFAKNVQDIEPSALALLEDYRWPGNVRELKHAIERAVLLTDGPMLRKADFVMVQSASQPVSFRLPAEGIVLEELERDLVRQALETTGWNQARAGKLLGLNRDQIRYRIDKFGLSRGGAMQAPESSGNGMTS
jgi:two-component system, NtrC family, response regulator AtoC